MERKGASSTVVLEVEELGSSLRRARHLTAEEEKVVRMRHGIGSKELSAPLPRASAGNVGLEDELLLIEMQLLRSYRAHGQPRAPIARAAAEGNTAKDKIIRALSRKK